MEMGSHLLRALLTLLFLLTNFAHTTRNSLWNRQSASDDLVFREQFLWEAQSRSRLDCARLCATDSRCESMTSTVLTSHSVTCRGHSQLMTSGGIFKAATKQYAKKVPPTYFLGSSWLTKPCTQDSDCSETNAECFEERCLCTPGYYYSSGLDSCQESCVALQQDFVDYPGWMLALNNMNVSTTSLEECRQWCLSLDHCLSLEYNGYFERCYLATVTARNDPNKWQKDFTGNVTYFQRTCT